MARVPSYRRHKPTGQARVTLGGRDFYLGKFGTPESKREYDRLIGEYFTNGGIVSDDRLTLVELTATFKKHAKTYYRGRDGKPSDWYLFIANVMRLLGKSPYGRRPADQFGPLALKAFREKLVAEGGGRKTINKKIAVVKQAFQWAASEELIPATVHEALRVVPGLRKGKTTARETRKVKPIEDRIVELTLPHMPAVVADMVRLQRLTGMRPAEVCLIRPCDVATDGDVWTYRPTFHKTEHHDCDRVVAFGPQAQAILRPYLLRDKTDYCFTPVESERKRRESQHKSRETPPGQGNAPGTNRKRKPKWAPGGKYSTDSYRRSIQRACEKAFNMPDDLDIEALQVWRQENVWAPNRLRHTAATALRKRFGLEAAQIALGHTDADTTLIYAERDLQIAADIMRQVG